MQCKVQCSVKCAVQCKVCSEVKSVQCSVKCAVHCKVCSAVQSVQCTVCLVLLQRPYLPGAGATVNSSCICFDKTGHLPKGGGGAVWKI